MSDLEIKLLGLIEGERVVAYQDDDEWDGIVRYDSSEPEGRQWYIELDGSSYRQISSDKHRGRTEGFRSGFVDGEVSARIKIAQTMLQHGVDAAEVQKYTELPMNKLVNLKPKR